MPIWHFEFQQRPLFSFGHDANSNVARREERSSSTAFFEKYRFPKIAILGIGGLIWNRKREGIYSKYVFNACKCKFKDYQKIGFALRCKATKYPAEVLAWCSRIMADKI